MTCHRDEQLHSGSSSIEINFTSRSSIHGAWASLRVLILVTYDRHSHSDEQSHSSSMEFDSPRLSSIPCPASSRRAVVACNCHRNKLSHSFSIGINFTSRSPMHGAWTSR